MKKSMLRYCFAFTLILLVAACGSEQVKIEKKFKEDQVILQINAQKTSSVAPWDVTLSAKAYGFEKGSLHFEQQVKSLSEANITFKWVDENTCIIGFPDDDGSVRQFKLIASATQFYLAEEPTN